MAAIIFARLEDVIFILISVVDDQREELFMKKFIKWIMPLVLSMIFMPCSNVLAGTTVSQEEKMAVILETGVPENFVENLSDSQINDYYMKFEGRNVKYKGTEEKIVEINENIDEKLRGTIPSSSLQLSISVFEDMSDTGAGEVYGLIVGANFKWLKQPICSLTDGMTVNWDGSLFNFQSFYAETGFMLDGVWYPKDYTNTPAMSANGGIGWFLDIASGNLNQGGGSIYLVPRRTFYEWENPNMQIDFNYAHEILGGSLSFGVEPGISGSGGVGIAGGNYDSQAVSKIYNRLEKF